jgi:hypothetical protein
MRYGRRVHFWITLVATLALAWLVWFEPMRPVGDFSTNIQVQAVEAGLEARGAAAGTYYAVRCLAIYNGVVLLTWAHALFWQGKTEEP